MEIFFGIYFFQNGEENQFFLGTWKKKDATKHDIMEDFLRELIEIWVDFNFRNSFLAEHDFCCSNIIWNNSSVRIAKRPFFYKHWAKAGVQNIKDLANNDFKVITYGELREKYCLSASFLSLQCSYLKSTVSKQCNAICEGSPVKGILIQ